MGILDNVVLDPKTIWKEKKGKGKVARAAMALVMALVKEEMGEFSVIESSQEGGLIAEYKQYLQYTVKGIGKMPQAPFSLYIEKGQPVIEVLRSVGFLRGCSTLDTLQNVKEFLEYIRDNG